MSQFISKVFLHPLFRFFFWLAVTLWLVVFGIRESGWIRWINIIMAFIALGTVIENAVKSVAYFKRDRRG